MRRFFFVLAALALVTTLTACSDLATGTPKPSAQPSQGNPTPAPSLSPTGGQPKVAKQYSSAPAMTIDPTKDYQATISTNYGDITVQLLVKNAPTTVNSFVFLARDGFYDGVKFHRIIKDFMIQGGDPDGTGAGGPGYRFADELPKELEYDRGVLAMANSGPNTNGSQFFITHASLKTRLQKNYTIFGKVTGGMDVVDKIAAVPVRSSAGGETSSPTVEVLMTGVKVTEK